MPQKICGCAKTFRAKDRTVERFMFEDDESAKMSRNGFMEASESMSPVPISVSPFAADIFVLLISKAMKWEITIFSLRKFRRVTSRQLSF